jgi:hypothetical protein
VRCAGYFLAEGDVMDGQFHMTMEGRRQLDEAVTRLLEGNANEDDKALVESYFAKPKRPLRQTEDV